MIVEGQRDGATRWRRKPMFAVALVGISVFCVYILLPRLLVAVMPFAEGTFAEDALVWFGPRAIDPTIAGIRKHDWERDYANYPSVLSRLGEPAHKRLIQAIDAEQSPDQRARLIFGLQHGFDDYSRLGTWVDAALSQQESPWCTFWLSAELRCTSEDAPPLLVVGDLRKINPDFVRWWAGHGRELIQKLRMPARSAAQD